MFFACDWEINKKGIEDIIHLSDAAASLNCIWLHPAIMTENGYRGARFIVVMPSEEVFHKFLELIVDLVFKNWYPIELTQSELPPSYLNPRAMAMSQWSGNSQMNVLRGYYEAAYWNEIRKEQKR